MKSILIASSAIFSLALSIHFAAAGAGKVGPAPAQWNAVVQNAARFLRGTQDKNGGWSTDKTPGVTGIVLTGLLKTGQTTPQDPVGKKALSFIESLVNPEKKHIAGKNPKVQLFNYVTSINARAFIRKNNRQAIKGK